LYPLSLEKSLSPAMRPYRPQQDPHSSTFQPPFDPKLERAISAESSSLRKGLLVFSIGRSLGGMGALTLNKCIFYPIDNMKKLAPQRDKVKRTEGTICGAHTSRCMARSLKMARWDRLNPTVSPLDGKITTVMNFMTASRVV
jgi:hypothetical protein